MYYQKKELLWGFVLASIGGILLHFVYHFVPNWFTALFSPVNESLWEHVKIVLFPYLITVSIITLGRPTAYRPWFLTALIISLGMLFLGWVYHIKLGGSSMVVDIGLFFLAMAIGFWLPTRFQGPFDHKAWRLPEIAVGILVVLVFYFTFFPPDSLLFTPLATKESFFPHPL